MGDNLSEDGYTLLLLDDGRCCYQITNPMTRFRRCRNHAKTNEGSYFCVCHINKKNNGQLYADVGNEDYPFHYCSGDDGRCGIMIAYHNQNCKEHRFG